MAAEPRVLPRQPSLRYLKLEAKNRLAAGEFTALHQAQLAIAREHGLPSWVRLKQRIRASALHSEGHALAQLRWVAARFGGGGQPSWAAPDEAELAEHFTAAFLAAVPPATLTAALSQAGGDLAEGPAVLAQTTLSARARLGGLIALVAVAPQPPHLITGLRVIPGGTRVTDRRVQPPVPETGIGPVPAAAEQTARWAMTELGLPGLALAGAAPGTPAWALTRGWADLDRAEPLTPGHRFPALGVTTLATDTAVLRLAAEGRVELDAPANRYLRTVRLADDQVTVRDLLQHTSGAANPPADLLFAAEVPGLAAITGAVVACRGRGGPPQPGNTSSALLGQIAADVTGLAYPQAVTRLVLDPLGLRQASFPVRAADLGPDPVTGYTTTLDGTFLAVSAQVCTLPAVGGLWASPGDLVRLGAGWSSLLPAGLAAAALRAAAGPAGGGYQVGLGWLIGPDGVAMRAGAGPGGTGGLLLEPDTGRVHVVLASKLVPAELIAARLRHPPRVSR